MGTVHISRLDRGLHSSTKFTVDDVVGSSAGSVMLVIHGVSLCLPVSQARRFNAALASILALPASDAPPDDCGCEPGICRQNSACPRVSAR